ncbi:MAG: putative metalloprotease CJM1_0395 family protein, partial [Kangiellaceae bacterium]|nr:putative metalloprotease CJM1_0395 family protein [Kangiellaceae bacterium]
MVVNPAPSQLPVYTANLPTEAVRADARAAERIPEAKATAENVNLKPSAEEAQANQRPERSEAQNDSANRTVEEKDQEQGSTQEEKQKQQKQRQEQSEVQELAARDREVRAHEASHAGVGGKYAGAPSYTYQRGPDGRQYAVAGEVSIDTSTVAGDPAA